MLKIGDIKIIADELYNAEKSGVAIDPIVARYSETTIECAYKIQMQNVKRRVEGGEKVVGKKVGLTSQSMQQLLGVYEPDYGHIFNTMVLNENRLSISQVLSPKVEGEIAFVMGKDLQGPNVTPVDIIRATDFVMPVFEVIDSRVRDWKIKIEDTIADNGSSAFVALGTKCLKLDQLDIVNTGMALYKNGELISTGSAAAVMGNPIYSVTWLVNKLAEFGVGIKQGEIILSGSLVAAVNIAENDVVEVVFDRLGQVMLKIVP